jgi:hypothetical protein
MSNLIDIFRKKHNQEEVSSEESTVNYNKQGDVPVENYVAFTIFSYEQACDFAQTLADHSHSKEGEPLHITERKAFGELTRTAFGSMDGEMGTCLLPFGTHNLYNKEGIRIDYEKIQSELDNNINEREGRSTIKLITPEGGLLIEQHKRNKGMFLIWMSDPISDRLRDVFVSAEAKVLDLNNLPMLTNDTPQITD